MFIWYTAQFELKRKHYELGAPTHPRARHVQCWMVPGTIDPLRDWEFDE